MRAHVLLLVVLVAGVSADEDDNGGVLGTIRNGFNRAGAVISSLYTTYESAPYTVQNTVKADDGETVLYEQRSYPAQKWVCTTEIDDDQEDSNKDAFMRLFGYITGENEGGRNIPMTVPVTMVREPLSESELAGRDAEVSEESDSEEVHSRYTMCFYINRANQESAPVPTNPEVFLQNRPTTTVIANQVGGYMDENDWEVLSQKLKADSTAKGESGVDYSNFYRAGYDSPMKFWNRRNEVWFAKQE